MKENSVFSVSDWMEVYSQYFYCYIHPVKSFKSRFVNCSAKYVGCVNLLERWDEELGLLLKL